MTKNENKQIKDIDFRPEVDFARLPRAIICSHGFEFQVDGTGGDIIGIGCH